MSAEESFYESLKQAEQMPDDENAPREGNPDVSTPPETVAPFSDKFQERVRAGREQLLDDLFNNKAKSDSAQQGIASQLLDCAKSGDFETSAIQLLEKSKTKIAEAPPTLRELVKGVAGRY